MITVLRFIASAMAPLTLAAAIVGFIWPQTFTLFGFIFKELFAATMFALGVVLNPADLTNTLKHPQRIVLGVLTQYIVMPLLAFTIATLAGLPPALALGFIIVGSAPGAMASNVIVYLAGGVLAFSIALTTVATFLSPVLTPLLVKYLGGPFMDIHFWQLMWTIIYILVVPLAGGMLLRHYLSRSFNTNFMVNHIIAALILLSLMRYQSDFANWQLILSSLFVLILPVAGSTLNKQISNTVLDWAREIAPAIASLAIIVICAFAVAKNQQQIANVGLLVFVLVILLNALGYVAGWYLAKLYRFDQAHQLTLSIEIGMQNAGMGVALALAHFSEQPEVALPGALFAVWCIITAAGATSWLRHKQTLVSR